MAFDRKHDLEERESEEDEIYGIFMGYKNVDPLVEQICDHFAQQPLEPRYKKVIEKRPHDHAVAFPNWQSFSLAIWLCARTG